MNLSAFVVVFLLPVLASGQQQQRRVSTSLKRKKTIQCGCIKLSSFFSVSSTQSGRQWVGELETARDCTFSVAGNPATPSSNAAAADRVALCNFTLSGPAIDGVYPFRKGLASLAAWLGGPTVDATNSTDGKYFNPHHFRPPDSSLIRTMMLQADTFSLKPRLCPSSSCPE